MTTEIRVLNTPELLSAAAATEIRNEILRLLEQQPRVRIVLTGGTLGIQILRDLRGLEIPVSKLDVFWGDERFIGLEQPDRNEHQALAAWPELLNSRLFRFPRADGTVAAAGIEFDRFITQELGKLTAKRAAFDILLLGMGPDGHIASLFPGRQHPAAWIVSEKDSPKPPAERLSFSYQALNRSAKVYFLVSGRAKVGVTRCALHDPDCTLPAAQIKGLLETHWFLDQELSREL